MTSIDKYREKIQELSQLANQHIYRYYEMKGRTEAEVDPENPEMMKKTVASSLTVERDHLVAEMAKITQALNRIEF